jgi:hypothetical protein
MDEFTQTNPPPLPAAKKRPLSNSMWARDSAGRLGMIGEINSGVVDFHYANGKGELSPATKLSVDSLTIASKRDVPEHLGLTDQQLADMGYE